MPVPVYFIMFKYHVDMKA